MSRALLIQLARLGDLIQSLPVITSLRAFHPEQPLDLLCPAPLVPIGRLFPGISTVYPWDGTFWQCPESLRHAPWKEQLQFISRNWINQAYPAYSVAYNLNNHPRGILAAHLFSERVMGPGEKGPLHPALPPWAGHLRQIAHHRGTNRVHLADAFCGMCQVWPPSIIPLLQVKNMPVPCGLERMLTHPSSLPIAIVLGAGDADRRIPLSVWQEMIAVCADHLPQASFVLIGGDGEQEAALAFEQALPARYQNRVVNLCGRTTLPQLASLLNHCQWVVGSDTGPLHLGALCGARVIGWYFSRARVHETGPYGEGHYVWQYERTTDENSVPHQVPILPDVWPVRETVDLISRKPVEQESRGWQLWRSYHDGWGAYYARQHAPDDEVGRRKDVWEALSLSSSGNEDWSAAIRQHRPLTAQADANEDKWEERVPNV